jgi:para-aminobenzoate synthetase
VRGTLAPAHDVLDAVAAAFPPGSMTGAPKVRTMRLIHELELAAPRGIYSGTLGFLSIDGAADLNVVIRTAVVTRAGVSLGAGGAVVAQSNAADEWAEVLLKARPVATATATAVTNETAT